METINDVLHFMQKNLVVPKNQYNNFGKYHYRSCEDIVEAVKKLLPSGAVVTLEDALKKLGDRYYIKSTAALIYKGEITQCSALARESLDKKGMDSSQITGAASSYARKYALNGLFMIDDAKDSDTSNGDSIHDRSRVLQEFMKLKLENNISRDTSDKWLAWGEVKQFAEMSDEQLNKLILKIKEMNNV